MKKQLLTLGVSLLASGAASAQVLETQSNNDYLHFSFPVAATQTLEVQSQKMHQVSSDEYWFRATGAELNKGVNIATTQAKVSILVAQGAKAQAKLDSGLLNLTAKNNRAASVIEKRVSADELAQVGLFANTVALTTRNDGQAGDLVLQTEQALESDAVYVITVKEKNSKHNLALNIQGQSFTAKDRVVASAKLPGVSSLTAEAQLVAPNGTVTPVNVMGSGDDLMFSVDDVAAIQSPVNGLYELRVHSTADLNGADVRRSAKVAFALSRNSASLERATLSQNKLNHLNATFNIVASEASRYEVRATLYGTNANGQMVPVMETHAAQNTNAGSDQIKMPFDASILAKASVNAPYELRNVRLFDQKQLGLVDQMNTSVTFGVQGEM